MALFPFNWTIKYYRQERQREQRYYQHQLYQAVINRDQAGVFANINHGACWTCHEPDGETVLHMAVSKSCIDPDEQKDIIKILEWFLKQKKLSVNVSCRAGKTPLHIAVKNGMSEVVNYLIGKGADLNARDVRGNWVAHYMVEGEFDRYVELTEKMSTPAELRPHYRESVHVFNQMLLKKIKVDCANKIQETPLQIAARRNLLHVIPILLQYSRDKTFRDKEKKTVLHLLFESKKRSQLATIETSCYDKPLLIDILKMTLRKGYSVNAVDVYGNTPLHFAFHLYEPELIEVIEIMLKKFKKVIARNNEGNTVLHLIIDNCIDYTLGRHKEECVKFVRILLSKDIDIEIPNRNGYNPVQLAVMRVHPTILQILRNHGAPLNESYNEGNLLHLLSQKSSDVIDSSKLEKVISLLVSQGCDINARDKNGMTPMHWAAQLRKNVIVGLIKCHANVDARELSECKLTPLQLAVDTNNDYSVSTLISVGADINAKDSWGRTALHITMKYKNNMVKTLLRLGAHVDVQDDHGLLPLHYAIRKRHDVALAELLKFGADINDMDSYRELVKLYYPGYMLFGVIEHWIKMKAVGIPVVPGYRRHTSDRTYQELYHDCLKEIEELKAYEIGVRTSLYDLLHMDWNFRCAYTVNKPFKDLIESNILETKFPKYHVLILASYHQAVARQPLLGPAKRSWCYLTKIMLPDVCIYRILAHLSNRDLRVMVEGSRDRSFRKPCNLLLSKGRRGPKK